jgi:hypothetical protein
MEDFLIRRDYFKSSTKDTGDKRKKIAILIKWECLRYIFQSLGVNYIEIRQEQLQVNFHMNKLNKASRAAGKM